MLAELGSSGPGRRWPVVVAGVLLMAACSSGDPSGPDGSPSEPTATSTVPSSPSPSEPVPSSTVVDGRFVSFRYGYSISLDEGWTAREATETVGPDEIPLPGAPQVDTLTSPSGSEFVVAYSVVLTEGSDLDAWVGDRTDAMRSLYPVCGEPTSEGPIEVGGEPAALLAFRCQDGFFVLKALAVHAGRGFDVSWISPVGNEVADERAFEPLRGSVRFEA